MKNISKHISYKEATRSYGAIRAGIDNTPNKRELRAMEAVAENCFEPLREWVGNWIKIESFLRKHTPNSQHFRGEAIDIDDDFGYKSNAEMFDWLAKNVEFDQLIWEFGDSKGPAWIHVSHKEGRNRRKFTVAFKRGKKTRYAHFTSLGILYKFIENYYR